MPATYRFASVVLWALLCVCTAAAQTTSSTAPAPAELNISIGARQIKFTPLRSYQELRLEIFNNSGELLYASGAITEAELNYDLHDSNGQPLAPGLYAYTLTVKAPDAAPPRQQQGHFIIEQGQEQIWLTSKDAASIGAAVTGGALTVAHSPERTTAGYLASGRTLSERAGLQRDTQSRNVTDKKTEVTREVGQLPLNISGSGTTNRVTKWLDGPNGVVGDSIMKDLGVTLAFEAPGAAPTPGFFPHADAILDLVRRSESEIMQRIWNTGGGGATLRYVAGRDATSQLLMTDTSEWLMSIAGNNSMGMQFRVREAFTPNNATQLNNSPRMTITRTGNVGIGITTPSHKLQVIGGNGTAVYGETQNGRGVSGVATDTGGWAVYGWAVGPNANVAGQFVGDVNVSGTLAKAGGSFKIDHPLDPANKFLSHSFVESPEMLNIYNGNVTTDNNGLAVVTLPDYFEALNRDFRYQLTVIGTFAQAIIAEKIKGNQFKIATSQPNVEVSWLVTGVRQDAWANKHRIPVEELKSEVEKGHFLHPELYHQPEEKSLHWVRDPQGLRRLEELRRENAQRPATEKPQKQ